MFILNIIVNFVFYYNYSMKQDKSSIIKIDVEELIGDFKVSNKEALQVYLKELWKDLSQRSDDKSKGISRVTFSKVTNLFNSSIMIYQE